MSPSDVQDALIYLKVVANSELVSDPCRTLCNLVLGDTLFRTCYGSAGKHHAYEGGLAVHVSEVVRGCLAMAEAYPEADKEVLIVSAIYHDFTKIYEYDVTKPGTGTYSDGEPVKYAKTQFSKYIRHVAGSYGEFLRNIDELDFPYSEAIMEKFMKIEHCILAHHGRREWGSPVEPQILEAQILHFADMLSYQYGEGR